MSKYLDEQGLAYLWTKAKGTFVGQEPGMVLSENNYSDEDKAKLDGMFNVGVFARNIGNIEGELTEARAEHAGIIQALAAANIRILNKNLLNPDAWWVNNGSANVVCGNAARYSKSGGAYMKSIKSYDYYTTEPTSEQTEGASYVYHRKAYTDATTGTAYPEAWYVYRDTDDGITTSCADLTGEAIITESNGETFNKALQYNITANSAWGNMETLYYPQGQSTQYYKQGKTPKSYGYRIDEMEVGKTYTVSCWARLTSGNEAWIKFGWGGTYMNSMGFPSDASGVSDVIKITGTDWKRVTWSFVFNPSGAEYTETTEQATDSNNQTYTRVVRSYNWQKRVLIGVHRKYTATLQLAGFRLSEVGLFGSNDLDTLAEEVAELRNSIAAAQAINTRLTTAESNVTALQTRLAEAEAKNECMQALGFAGHGIRVEKVFSGVNDTGIGEYILEANHEAGDAYAYRNGSGWIVMAYNADNDSWVSWPTT